MLEVKGKVMEECPPKHMGKLEFLASICELCTGCLGERYGAKEGCKGGIADRFSATQRCLGFILNVESLY